MTMDKKLKLLLTINKKVCTINVYLVHFLLIFLKRMSNNNNKIIKQMNRIKKKINYKINNKMILLIKIMKHWVNKYKFNKQKFQKKKFMNLLKIYSILMNSDKDNLNL